MPINIRNAYLAMHKASGIKVGDIVKIIRAAEEYEMGWVNGWNRSMTRDVGKYFEVTRDIGQKGFRLGVEGFKYPFFCLEKIEGGRVEAEAESMNDAPLRELNALMAGKAMN